jgi:hypothetical protein
MESTEQENIHYTIEGIDENDVNKDTVQVVSPKIIFIVPYRDREQQQLFFASHMQSIMSDYRETDYKICYIHQHDTRTFNRGAMKNIGFLFVKEQYPNNYKDITLVFNDVDTMPFTKNFLPYETTHNNVKHFYGFTNTLGGIVSIKAGDFEKINGFPNYWAWGYEDNLLLKRILNQKMNVDRSVFYLFKDKNIMQFADSSERTINKIEYKKYTQSLDDGINKLLNVKYDYNDKTGFVDVVSFDTYYAHDKSKDVIYDIKKGPRPFGTKRHNIPMYMPGM